MTEPAPSSGPARPCFAAEALLPSLTLAPDLPGLVETYGLWAVGLGAILEGETVLLLGGFFAHRGYMNPVAVWAVAALGAFVGDQIWFWLGREHGPRLLERFPRLAAGVARADPVIARHPAVAAISVRFLYGLRLAGPIALGMTSIPATVFAVANAAGAAVWAAIFTAIGWTFGLAATRVLADIGRHEGWLALVLLAAGLAIFAVMRHQNRRRPR
jgi:membrane protein DedA with SNARE-associated domain